MGNNTSSISISNPTWKHYQIQRVERSPNSIKFFLDRDVKYSNGYYDYVNCDNAYPYYDIHAGDCIEVNWYRSEDYNSWHEFTGSDNLSVIRFIQRLREYAVEVPNGSGRELFRINRINSIESLFLLGALTGPGEFIIERKTEWRGNTKIEYIEKLTVFDSDELRYSIETRNIHYAR